MIGSEAPDTLAFGRFRVLPRRRELLADGQPLKLGGRAFDLLMALLATRGEVISKESLTARVWPNRVVEENVLHAQISALRTALGSNRDLIQTVAGRGYQFIGEIQTEPASIYAAARTPEAAAEPCLAKVRTNLPQQISELIGREVELKEILKRTVAHRLVTLTGAAGIGKTRLALAVAHRLLPRFPDGVWLAELAPLATADLVPVAVARAAGVELSAGAISPERVANALAGKRLLVVLDNCEHLINSAALMAEALLHTAADAWVLATSREPLRAEGEWVYRVPPLAVPAENAPEGNTLLHYGAVRLFVERARAANPQYIHLGARNLASVATICRRLDGIPLAIELAAARVGPFAVEQIAGLLDDRFRLLSAGRRTALPRHQTLRAMLDWSYDLLTESERLVLHRLGIFAGSFGLEAASTVIVSPELAATDAIDGVQSLIVKSLVAANIDTNIPRFRLLETTHAYALEKLNETGEHGDLARRHAEYYRDLFERAETEAGTRPRYEWLADYGWQIDNLRAALDWAFSPNGNADIGVALTVAAIPLWMHLSLLEECRGRVEQALSQLSAQTGRDARREMKLYAALAASSLYSKGAAQEFGSGWRKALAIAERLNDAEYQLRSIWGLWAFHLATGDWRITLEFAERFSALVADRPDTDDRIMADRMIGFSRHYLGDQGSARLHIERMLANFALGGGRSRYAIRFQFDQRVAARAMLGRILWLQGFPEQAMRTVQKAVEDAHAINHPISMCYALALSACHVALWVGDLMAAERYAGMLLDYATRHALPTWRVLGVCFQGVLLIKRGDILGGLQMLRTGFDEAGEGLYAMNRLMFLAEMAEGLGRAGQTADGLAVAERAIERAEHIEEGWLIADLLRLKGVLLLSSGQPVAEEYLRQSVGIAHQQGALSWELLAGISLARLLADQGRPDDAKKFLQGIYDRFTEGFETADLKAARTLLHELE